MSKLGQSFGAVFLIIGTAIGGGLLALPVAMAEGGLGYALLYLGIYWLLMTAGAFSILELSIRFPPGSDLITMARKTLGPWGQLLTWVTYLGLLYTLLSAYIGGGGELVVRWLSGWLSVSALTGAMLFILVMGSLVCCGIYWVDRINRIVMSLKALAFLGLLLVICPHISSYHPYGCWQGLLGSVMVMVTSFGYAIIIPSLRTYFAEDTGRLRRVVWLGSLIPLCCYVVWVVILFHVLPYQGPHSLTVLEKSTSSLSSLMSALVYHVHSQWIVAAVNIFASLCMLTAFLGVGVALIHFLSDGIPLRPSSRKNWLVRFTAFVPPLLMVEMLPQLFYWGIKAAGIFCIVLLVMMPVLMLWRMEIGRGFARIIFRLGAGFILLFALLTLWVYFAL